MIKKTMAITIKIRGIYSTALTRFFMDRGCDIVLPSGEIKERFKDLYSFTDNNFSDLTIIDRRSGIGIRIQGKPDKLEKIYHMIRDIFWDAAFYKNAGTGILKVEFSLGTLHKLDDIRDSVIPTIVGHHRFRNMDIQKRLDHAEKECWSGHPEERDRLSRDMEKRLVWDNYEKGKFLRIEHVKLNDKKINLSPGKIVQADFGRGILKLERTGFKAGGRYDGLNVPIYNGDYCITEVTEGDWFYRQTYYRGNGKVLGEYWNINTPIEFYPDKIRYLDLEIDLVRSIGMNIQTVDRDELEKRIKSGVISKKLERKTKSAAEELSEKLRR